MLSQINLDNKGYFIGKLGGFVIKDKKLERPWNYLYATDKVLLRLTNYGLHSCQINPPSGIMLFKTPLGENSLPFQIFIEYEHKTLTSFLTLLNQEDLLDYQCVFLPGYARYILTYKAIKIITDVGISSNSPAIWLNCKVENISGGKIDFTILPAWRIFHASATLAPWDVPEVYQTCGFFNNHGNGIYVENRDPHGQIVAPYNSYMMTDFEIAEAEVDYRRFAQDGNMLYPERLHKPLSIQNNQIFKIGNIPPDFLNVGTSGVGAFRSKTIKLDKDESFSFTISFFHNAESLKTPKAVERTSLFLDRNKQLATASEVRDVFKFWTGKLKINLPDKKLEEYIQNYLPWQLYWVGKLDRGWPTGMRGTRDAAQDYSGISFIEPEMSKKILIDIFSCQKPDGGFLRQFSTSGPEGKHDTRDYVDSGCWVFELLYDYLRNSGDMNFLNYQCRSLDSAKLLSIGNHAKKILEYYLADWNKGEHGLILMRGGDWNDSLNTVGLERRGESVMVSCQVVFILGIAGEIFPEDAQTYKAEALKLKNNIRKYALNSKGF